MVHISVIMPVYNAEKTLASAIESIVNQTDPGWELVMVDDGSDDQSAQIIGEWSSRDDRINPVYTPHRGIVSALNTGIKHSSGKYLARMDADDIALPERLEKQRIYLDENTDIGIVSCKVKHLGDKKEKAGYARYVQWINSLISHEEIALNRFIESPLAHPSVMFRRKIVDRFGGYRDGTFPEDYELWLRWLQKGVRAEKIPDVLLKWRDEPERLSRTHQRYSVEAFYQTKARYLASWLKEHNPHHPEIIVWGAGRTSRKRADLLLQHGIDITHYIDIDPNKIGHVVHGRPVLGTDELPVAGSAFIVTYVGRHGANEMIRQELETRKYTLGKHYIFAA